VPSSRWDEDGNNRLPTLELGPIRRVGPMDNVEKRLDGARVADVDNQGVVREEREE
jgi:hypothetical protein